MASLSACFFGLTPKSHALSLSPKTFKPLQSHYTPLPSLILTRSTKFRSGKTSVSVIRASSSSNSSNVDVATSSAIRPGVRVESDKLPSGVRNRAMDAIDSSGRRVTIGDMASKAGLKLNEAQKALQALAADSNGFLEVSDEGDTLYVFPKDYRSKLAAKSFRIKMEPLLEKGKIAAGELVKVSFGMALMACIVLVHTTLTAIATISRESDNHGRRKSYKVTVSWYGDPYRKGDGGMNVFESVSSFVFGDGDANQGIEEERWNLIGQYITSNGGVVTAEELAPYLDLETNENTDDDSYILPVLLWFDGQPEVDEDGNILYRFPSLQCTAAPQRSGQKEYVGRRCADWVGEVEKFFKEKKWQFSKTSASERATVIGLGGVNLFGVIILGTMLKDVTVRPSAFISFVSDIYPLLQIYAVSFFAIPLIRWLFMQNKNAKIVKRNRAREQRARALESPDLSLRQKLLSARDMAQRTFIGKDRIVYSTERDLYEQDYDETRDWIEDLRRLKSLTK